jgi:hypothetical protein
MPLNLFFVRSHRRLCLLTMLGGMLAGSVVLACTPALAIDMGELAGDWVIPSSHEILSISDGVWNHPKYGRAKLRRGDDSWDIKVSYEYRQTRCFYRVAFTDHGNTLVLASADERQDSDRCPTGHFKSVNH